MSRLSPILFTLSILGLLLCGFLLLGLFVVNPNEAKVLQLFGKYVGTARRRALRFANPFYAKRRISLRVRNFESAKLKVNDLDGNPIEIAAVVVWKVVDTAEAIFEVDDYENYVHVQSESALRNMATSYPYDAHEDAQLSLRGNTAAIADHLRKEIQERLSSAGVEVIEARISHLAYAPEIAAAMLQRQQAGAIIAARQRIVEGAVGMVEMALDMLSREERRGARRRAEGGDGQQPARRALQRAQHAADRERRHAPPLRRRGWRSARLSCSDRSRPARRAPAWADDELRSLNGQIEFVLRRVLQEERPGRPCPRRSRTCGRQPEQWPSASDRLQPVPDARRLRSPTRTPRRNGHAMTFGPGRGGAVPALPAPEGRALRQSHRARACSRTATGSATGPRARRSSRCTGSRDRARRTTCSGIADKAWAARLQRRPAEPAQLRRHRAPVATLYHSGLTADVDGVMSDAGSEGHRRARRRGLFAWRQPGAEARRRPWRRRRRPGCAASSRYRR